MLNCKIHQKFVYFKQNIHFPLELNLIGSPSFFKATILISDHGARPSIAGDISTAVPVAVLECRNPNVA